MYSGKVYVKIFLIEVVTKENDRNYFSNDILSSSLIPFKLKPQFVVYLDTFI